MKYRFVDIYIIQGVYKYQFTPNILYIQSTNPYSFKTRANNFKKYDIKVRLMQNE